MNKNSKILNINNINKSFNRIKVLNKVGFDIKSGELVVLLGPNGAGKSTLFSIISGLTVPDKGDCKIDGFSIIKEPVKALRNLGLVFQQPTIDTELTIKENLFFHARLQGLNLRSLKNVIDSELIKFNIYNKLNNKVRNLSGGEKRKVELIRSVLHKPRLLLMDEPTVGLDPNSRKELLNKILKLKAREKLSILWATHLVDEAEKADKIIILKAGNIVEMGHPKNIIKKTKSANLDKAFFKIVEKV